MLGFASFHIIDFWAPFCFVAFNYATRSFVAALPLCSFPYPLALPSIRTLQSLLYPPGLRLAQHLRTLCTSLSLSFLSLSPYIRTFLICSIYTVRKFTTSNMPLRVVNVDDTLMNIELALPLRSAKREKTNAVGRVCGKCLHARRDDDCSP